MKQSKLFTKTLKEAPKGEKSVNAVLLQRAGFIYKEMAGVYTFLPLGLRVLRKIEEIIREEMNRIGAKEILASVFQSKDIWQKTDRWDKEIGEVMYKTEEEIGLGPTHEEMITDIIKKYVSSYEDLPLYVFQIQNKFRKELRPKSGLLRGREFQMKDLYSFHKNEEDFWNYYDKVKEAYFKVFRRCGLDPIYTEASGEGFTGSYTHEFQVLAEDGEDEISYCQENHFARNKEIAREEKCPVCGKKLLKGKAIEVGNIFPLGTKYSVPLKAFYQDEKGEKKPIVMGSYGIGISRLVGALVEVFHDEKGIIWPENVAPFKFHLVALFSGDEDIDKEIREKGEEIHKKMEDEVLYDDRDKSAGEKLVDSDLIGIPNRIVLSPKTIKKGSVEVKKRNKEEGELISISELTKKYV